MWRKIMEEQDYGTFKTRKQGNSVTVTLPKNSGIPAGVEVTASGFNESSVTYKVVKPRLKKNRFKNFDRSRYDFEQDIKELNYNLDDIIPVGRERLD